MVVPHFAGVRGRQQMAGYDYFLHFINRLRRNEYLPKCTDDLLFQIQIPEAIRARVFGVFWAALFVTTPVGLWIYGALLSKVPWFYVTTVSGVLMITFGLLFAGHKYFRDFCRELG